jgi:hypothetical protein
MEVLVLVAAVLPFACGAAPVFVTSDPNVGWSIGGYYVRNNRWNSGLFSETRRRLNNRGPKDKLGA